MSKYDPVQIVARIEEFLRRESPTPTGTPESPDAGDPSLRRAGDDLDFSVTEQVHSTILRPMRRYERVDMLPGDTRLSLFKKAAMRLLRLVAAPQAVHNELTGSAVQVLAESLDRVRQRVRTTAEEDARQRATLLELMGQLREALEAERAETDARIEADRAATIARIEAERADTATRLEELRAEAAKRLDAAEAARAASARESVALLEARAAAIESTIHTETERLHTRIGDELAGVWKGLSDRDRVISETRHLATSASGWMAESDRIHRRIGDEVAGVWKGLEERDARLASMAATLGGLSQLAARIEELHRRIGDEVAGVWKGLEERDARLASMAATLGGLSQLAARIEELHRRIGDEVAGIWKDVEAREGRLRAVESRLSEGLAADLAALHQRITDEAAGLWKAMEAGQSALEENVRQLGVVTAGVQTLHHETGAIETRVREASARVLADGEHLVMLQESVDRLLNGSNGTAPTAAPAAAATAPRDPGAAPRKAQLDLAYLRFQRLFRGDEELLRERQRRYIGLLAELLGKAAEGSPRILDVACGDGIFLDLVKERGWKGEGIDLNSAMVKLARERGLLVQEGDALELLEQMPAAHADAIVTFQFVEHLEPDALMRLLRACRHVLKPGGILLVETLNPNTLSSLRWFHLDLTHCRLVFPEMLRLLAETAGLRFETWRGINEVDPGDRLKPTGMPAVDDNIARLNSFLYGPQDYFLVARRPPETAPKG